MSPWTAPLFTGTPAVRAHTSGEVWGGSTAYRWVLVGFGLVAVRHAPATGRCPMKTFTQWELNQMAGSPKCFCGHVARNHIENVGLCMFCKRPKAFCLIFRPTEEVPNDE